MIEKTGKSYTLKGESEINSLKEEIKMYMDHANEVCTYLQGFLPNNKWQMTGEVMTEGTLLSK